MFFRIRIGDDVFRSGDSRIVYLAVELSENARTSNCRFELYDPGLAIAGKYFLASYETGGIQVPSDLIATPPPPSAVVGTGGGGTTPPPPGGAFSPGEHNEQILIAECLRQGITIPAQIAYVLGTCYHESDRFNTMEEYASGDDYEYRDDLGNTQPGDGARFKGRGYVQLTGRTNYQKYTELSGKDLISSPELLGTDSGLAAFVTVHGMRVGHFTGVGLSDYTSGNSVNFVGARAIVNGSDRAGLIAGYSDEYLVRLTSGDLAQFLTGAAPAPATPPPAPATPPIQDEAATDTSPEESTPNPETPPLPTAPQKGTEVIVEVGATADNTIAYHFIHTGTSAKGRAPDTVAFTAKSIRWEMSRRTINSSWEGITLRELAQIVCDEYGRTLEMEGDGPLYSFLDATGITYLDLLRRECRSIGYRITDNGNSLILEPYRPQFTGFVVTRNILLDCEFSDEATADNQASTAIAASAPPDPTSPEEQAAEPVLESNPLTGEVEQANPENSTGVGGGESAVVTGSPTPPVTGTVQPQATEGEESGGILAAVVEAAEAQIPNNPLPVYTGIPSEDVTGLPTQQIGSIDLADGSALAEVIRDESRRVKGYPSSVSILTVPAALQLAPGSIIALAQNCFDNEISREAFAKEWRVGNVKHALYPSRKTTLEIYTPQAQRPPQAAATVAAPGAPAASTGQVTEGVTLQPGQHIWPMHLEENTSCGPICEFGYERGRLHGGIDIGGYGNDSIWASADGTVAYVDMNTGTGYGIFVDIDHPDGSMTRYAHLDSTSVSVGQAVKQGEQIGIRGWTGMDGPHNTHLHYEIHVGGSTVDPRTVLPRPGLINFSTGDDSNNAIQG